MQIQITTNVDEVIRALQRYRADLPAIVQEPLDRGAMQVLAGMKPYPPPPPESRYVRGAPPHSENLGKRWTSRRIRGQEYVGREVGNNASYAPWVQSSELQARVHQGRWQTDQEVIERELPGIVADVEQALRRAADRAGG